MDVIVILNGGAVIEVLPDAQVIPPNGQRVEADPAMLRGIENFAFLAVNAGVLVLDEVAQLAAQATKRAADEALRQDALAKELAAKLDAATAAQIGAYVDAQVTDLAGARTMFKRILLLLASRGPG